MTTAAAQPASRRRGGYALSGVALRGVVCAVPGEPVANAIIAETLGRAGRGRRRQDGRCRDPPLGRARPDQRRPLLRGGPAPAGTAGLGARQRRRADLRHPDPGPSAASQRLPAARTPGPGHRLPGLRRQSGLLGLCLRPVAGGQLDPVRLPAGAAAGRRDQQSPGRSHRSRHGGPVRRRRLGLGDRARPSRPGHELSAWAPTAPAPAH
jgi:hypothetical protein